MKKLTICSALVLTSLFALSSCANYGKKLSKSEKEDWFNKHIQDQNFGDEFNSFKRFKTLGDCIHFEGKTYNDGKLGYTCSGDISFKNYYFKADLTSDNQTDTYYIVKYDTNKFKEIITNTKFGRVSIFEDLLADDTSEVDDKFIKTLLISSGDYGFFVQGYAMYVPYTLMTLNPNSKTATGDIYKDGDNYTIVGKDNYKETKSSFVATYYKDCLMKYNSENDSTRNGKKFNYKYECEYKIVDKITIDDTSKLVEK